MAKICCGGFELGEGLELDGKTLKATGGAGGGTLMVNMTLVESEDEEGLFEIRTDAIIADIITELKSGKNVFAVLDLSGEEPWFEFLPLEFARILGNEQRVMFGINEALEDDTSVTYRVAGVYSGGVDTWEYIQI